MAGENDTPGVLYIFGFQVHHIFTEELFGIDGVGDFLSKNGFSLEAMGNKLAMPTNSTIAALLHQELGTVTFTAAQ